MTFKNHSSSSGITWFDRRHW